MKEPYVKPTVTTEILKAEVLNGNFGSGCPGDQTFHLGFPKK
jgi:hypothetical protein